LTQDLAIELADDTSELAGRKFSDGPPAALSVSGPWRELGPGRARLEAFVVARELAAEAGGD
jgi:hypothetical protein